MPDDCIKCGSMSITNTEPGITEGKYAYFDVECEDCGAKWREHYKLMAIECDDGEMIIPKDKPDEEPEPVQNDEPVLNPDELEII